MASCADLPIQTTANDGVDCLFALVDLYFRKYMG